jgi:hypothetical protein
MTATLRIPVQESLLEILTGLGSLEIVTVAALRRYALDRCLQRIEQAERQIAFYIEEAQAWQERLERILRESWPSLAPS